MGLLTDLFKRKSEEEDIPEVPEEPENMKQVTVRIEPITDFVDVDRVARLVKGGDIVFIKARELQRQDLGEYQNCVTKLKKLSNQFGWDIVGTEEGYLILTPQSIRIAR